VAEDALIPAPAEPDTRFQATPELVDAVNAALYLRRPLLVTGAPGSGKSSLIYSVAGELRLGALLRWHVTSSSTLQQALYRYDALGRLQEHQLHGRVPPVSAYLRLGPLGTALLPSHRPRALLIDEIDKSDVDLPNDLLDVLERGHFEIPELTRLPDPRVEVPVHDGQQLVTVERGTVTCREFPFVVLTSNGERDFPAPFLRRCVQFEIPRPTPELLTRIVQAHLGDGAANSATDLIHAFADELTAGRAKATDQLLNAIFLLTQAVPPDPAEVQGLKDLLLRELETDPL